MKTLSVHSIPGNTVGKFKIASPKDGRPPLNIKKAIGFRQAPRQFKKKEFENTLNANRVGIFSEIPAEAKATLDQRRNSVRTQREQYYFIDWNNRVKTIKGQQKDAAESKFTNHEYMSHLEGQLDQIKLEIDHIFGPGTDIFERLDQLAISDTLNTDVLHSWRNEFTGE